MTTTAKKLNAGPGLTAEQEAYVGANWKTVSKKIVKLRNSFVKTDAEIVLLYDLALEGHRQSLRKVLAVL